MNLAFLYYTYNCTRPVGTGNLRSGCVNGDLYGGSYHLVLFLNMQFSNVGLGSKPIMKAGTIPVGRGGAENGSPFLSVGFSPFEQILFFYLRLRLTPQRYLLSREHQGIICKPTHTESFKE